MAGSLVQRGMVRFDPNHSLRILSLLTAAYLLWCKPSTRLRLIRTNNDELIIVTVD